MNWEKFDQTVDTETINKQIEDAKNGDFGDRELESGTYTARLEKLELGETKDGRPMLKGMFRIVGGSFNNWCMFYNRVLYGTKNDGSMIHSANEFLRSLVDWEEDEIKFTSYSEYAELAKDVFDDTQGVMYTVEYDADAFDSIKVTDAE